VSSSPLATKKNKLIFAASWLAWALLHVTLLYRWGYSWQSALTDMLLTNSLLAAVSLLLSNNLRYYRPRKGKYLYILIVCVAMSGLWAGVVRYGVGAILQHDETYFDFLDSSMPIRFNLALLVTGCVSLMSELWYALEEQKESEDRKSAAEKLAREAELYNLRRQLQPHFLFNSLNSISALVNIQPEQSRKMIQQLSDFLRGTLKKEENQWTSFGEEVEHLQLYLEIEKVRFGYRLNTDTIIDEKCNARQIPHMMLQPVVENAIKFGLYDTTEPVTIRVEARVEEPYLVVTVQNPFDPETSSPRQGTGFGLSSVQRRLYLLFYRNDLLTTSAENNLFTTTIKIPQV
jgi:two-component system, LytTR family, sensor kinase